MKRVKKGVLGEFVGSKFPKYKFYEVKCPECGHVGAIGLPEFVNKDISTLFCHCYKKLEVHIENGTVEVLCTTGLIEKESKK